MVGPHGSSGDGTPSGKNPRISRGGTGVRTPVASAVGVHLEVRISFRMVSPSLAANRP